MFRQKEWFFSGESGKKYTFEICPKSGPIPEEGGIFILTYTHPRGHLAGYEVHILHVGETDNFHKTIANPPKAECLKRECWNCIYLYKTKNEEIREEILKDLVSSNNIIC